jgi:signal peptidase I
MVVINQIGVRSTVTHTTSTHDDTTTAATAEVEERAKPRMLTRRTLRLVRVVVARTMLWFVGFLFIIAAVFGLMPFGPFSATIVKSGSMQPGIGVGDVVVAKEIGEKSAVLGHVVTYEKPGESDELITHRIVYQKGDDLVTRGDANPDPDSTTITRDDIEGRGFILVPWIGLPAHWAATGDWAPFAATVVGLGALGWAARDNEPDEDAEAATKRRRLPRLAPPGLSRRTIAIRGAAAVLATVVLASTATTGRSSAAMTAAERRTDNNFQVVGAITDNDNGQPMFDNFVAVSDTAGDVTTRYIRLTYNGPNRASLTPIQLKSSYGTVGGTSAANRLNLTINQGTYTGTFPRSAGGVFTSDGTAAVGAKFNGLTSGIATNWKPATGESKWFAIQVTYSKNTTGGVVPMSRVLPSLTWYTAENPSVTTSNLGNDLVAQGSYDRNVGQAAPPVIAYEYDDISVLTADAITSHGSPAVNQVTGYPTGTNYAGSAGNGNYRQAKSSVLSNEPTPADPLASGGNLSSFTGWSYGRELQHRGSTFIGSNATYAAPQDYAIATWVKASGSQDGRIMGFGDGGNADGTDQIGSFIPDYHDDVDEVVYTPHTDNSAQSHKNDRALYMDGNGRLNFRTGQGNGAHTMTTPSGYRDGNWHLVVVSQSSSQGQAMYVDGARVTRQAGWMSTWSYTGSWREGWDTTLAYNNVGGFNGSLNDTLVYHQALTDQQQQAIWHSSRLTSPAGGYPQAGAGLLGLRALGLATQGTDFENQAPATEAPAVDAPAEDTEAAAPAPEAVAADVTATEPATEAPEAPAVDAPAEAPASEAPAAEAPEPATPAPAPEPEAPAVPAEPVPAPAPAPVDRATMTEPEQLLLAYVERLPEDERPTPEAVEDLARALVADRDARTASATTPDPWVPGPAVTQWLRVNAPTIDPLAPETTDLVAWAVWHHNDQSIPSVLLPPTPAGSGPGAGSDGTGADGGLASAGIGAAGLVLPALGRARRNRLQASTED